MKGVRYLWLVPASVLPFAAGTSVQGADSEPPRTLLRAEVPPERRNGRTFLPLRAVATALGRPVQWRPETRVVTVQGAGQAVELRVGSRSARIDGREVELEAAPFIRQGRALIPVRFAAAALGVPVRYEAETESVLVGPANGGTLWLVPLESLRAGIVIHSPRPGARVSSPLQVRGQANVFEGTVVVELRAGGRVLAQGVGTGAMGQFAPFDALLSFDAPVRAQQAELWAYSPSPKDGVTRLALRRVPVVLEGAR